MKPSESGHSGKLESSQPSEIQSLVRAIEGQTQAIMALVEAIASLLDSQIEQEQESIPEYGINGKRIT